MLTAQRNAAGFLLERMAQRGGAILRPDGRGVNSEQLAARALGLSGWLGERGVQPGDRVVVLIRPGAEFAAAVLAVLAAGGVAVLLDPDQPAALYRSRLELSAPRFVLTEPLLAALLGRAWLHPLLRHAGLRLPPPHPSAALLVPPRNLPTPAPLVPRSGEDAALVLYTSGTTAAPRGVLHTHDSLRSLLLRVAGVTAGLAPAKYLAETPQQLFYALALGLQCFVVTGRGRARTRRALDLLHRHPIDTWFGSPHFWQEVLRTGRPPPAPVRNFLLGSAPVTRTFLRMLVGQVAPDAVIRCLYGLSESGPLCAIDGREKAAGEGEGDWIGPPLAETELRLADGELVARCPASAAGYLRPPEAGSAGPRRPLKHEPFEGGWVRTGDLARIDPGGVHLLGRSKDMIIRRGVNLYPALLEARYEAHADEAAIVGLYDQERADERVVLVLGGRVRKAPDPAADEDSRPDHILTCPALPRSGRQNKVDKRALRSWAAQQLGLAHSTVSPLDPEA